MAGASGSLGRHVIREALRRGHTVRALIHRSPLPEEFTDVVAKVHRADALDRPQLAGVCDGVGVVFSCLGASVMPSFGKGRRSYRQVDTPANCNLIDEALRAGVERFVYVSVAGRDTFGHLEYVRAHEDVVAALDESGLDYAVVRPTGFFSAFAEFLRMAAKGPVPLIGNGTAETNPIHDADLASVCVDAMEGQARHHEVGGPEIVTRRGIVERAFAALHKPVRLIPMPATIVRAMALLMRPINPRVSHFSAFVAAVSMNDLVAPPHGSRILSDYFAELSPP
ncbi:MAG: SDR family oxidoreductase [Gemmatimonadetes bacterium]|nr:SDR family oxidoreductase [Gemmatimonadota bacterium]